MIKQIINSFIDLFKRIEENYSPSTIKSIIKSDDNYSTLFEIGPDNKDNNVFLSGYEIITNKQIRKMLNKHDLSIVRNIVFSEGDIFLKEKLFAPNSDEYYQLYSILTEETWYMSLSEIESNPDLMKRLNLKYFNRKLQLI